MKSLCVFCGSNPGTNPLYAQKAAELGGLLAHQGLSLVYGGASVGIMGAVADSVLKSGGQVFGVIPRSLASKEVAHSSLTKLYIVESMHERKQLMFDLSDGFMTLPGGLGSLEEFCEILTWAQLGFHRKPCGLLNVSGFYSHLISQLKHCVQEGMMKPEHQEMIVVDENPAKLLEKMRVYHAPVVEKWIEQKET